MKPQAKPRAYSENEVVRLVWIAIFISVFSFLYYNRRGDVLLYGDAVAHINIARRVFDSRTPGILQLGTVWLPLPHLLIMPFIVSNKLWQSGMGGSFPSMVAFVWATLGIFRLMRSILSREGKVDDEAKVWAWLAAITFAANPNLIYMQATAMGESLYLAFFIWAVVFLVEFVRQENAQPDRLSPLTKCGLCLIAACLTRYDGWFLAGAMALGAVFIAWRGSREIMRRSPQGPSLRSTVLRFVLLCAAAPLLWLAYNAAVYQNPLEFENGPYSAQAIEAKTATVNPGKDNILAGGSYFLKAAELNVGEPAWLGRLWLVLVLIGSAGALVNGRGRAALFLFVPLPFYALSVAYAKIPIFVPPWWPFTIYNVRYGLELLPAFAVFGCLGISFLARYTAKTLRLKPSIGGWSPIAAIVVWLILVFASYSLIWRSDPVCYREASVNSRARVALDNQLAKWFGRLPPTSTFLMYLGEHAGALEQAGTPLRQTINEGNHRIWKQPVDSEGLWERALADPARYADYAIGFQGDQVWKTAQEHHLTALVEIHTMGEPAAAIFMTHVQPAVSPTQ